MTAASAKRPAPLDPPAGDGIALGTLAEATGFLLKRAQIAVFQDFIATFAEQDIRPAQFSVLTVVAHNPGLSQSQVAAALSIKRTNFVPLLDTLERRGLVKRTPGATDRRSHALYLTAAGEALLERLTALWRQHENRLLERLGAEERLVLHGLLNRLMELGDQNPADEGEEAEAAPPARPGRKRAAALSAAADATPRRGGSPRR